MLNPAGCFICRQRSDCLGAAPQLIGWVESEPIALLDSLNRFSAPLLPTTQRLVKLIAQHGFSDGLKTVEGLRKELIDGSSSAHGTSRPKSCANAQVVVPSDLFGLAMPVDESPFERAQEIGFGPLSRDAGRKVLARAGASEAD